MSSLLPPIMVNLNILEMEYAVRGPIPMRAAELEKQGMKIIPCHIGNPQALGRFLLHIIVKYSSMVEDPSNCGPGRKHSGTVFEETPVNDIGESDFICG